ncbi:QueT transporter family protein [Enterococcus thailandicus]|uniref:QueT transporter family protein n=1 Tax=Enterococcus thailandicus TaxID=417368 RepID=UPI0022EC10F2|nr:QueT transporter family protein [Enterococcus thailandicus]MDA3974196.1 QueT transporter family protein [Enterococcus thailandicus]MDA3976642.1 QueT transporter family protein [Enterococcus thailandicus]MDA3981650.1 QueT transporter family protein [Enterococcus thailandicus]
MEQKNSQTASRWTTTEVATMALATGLYVAVTVFLAVISFGAIQIRLSEMFNYLSLYNKKYIISVTLGVALANLASPLGLIDVIVGSVSTLIVLLINYQVTKRVKNMKIKMVITALIFAFSMFTVAGQLTFLYQAPFFFNWAIIALGELVSMAVGGVIIYWMSKKIDLTK